MEKYSRRAHFQMMFDPVKIKPNTDISGVKLVQKQCPCGSIFRVTPKSKQKNCSRICADLPMAVGVGIRRDLKKKIDDHFERSETGSK